MTPQTTISTVASRSGLSRHSTPAASKKNTLRLLAVFTMGTAFLLAQTSPAWATNAVSLGAATNFAVLGATPSVTNTGATTVTGDLGISPAASVTGFPPGIVACTVHRADGVAAAA